MRNLVIGIVLMTVVPSAFAQRLSPQGGAVVKVDAAPGSGIVVTGTTAKPLIGVDTTAIQSRVTGTCSAGSSIRMIASDGSVTCEVDDIGTAGAGLTLLSGVFAIDPAYTQRRVTGTCTAGSSIRAIAQDGSVTCETDDAGITNSAGANVIPKSDGANLVASTWTDDGTTTTATTNLSILGAASVSGNATIGGTLDVGDGSDTAADANTKLFVHTDGPTGIEVRDDTANVSGAIRANPVGNRVYIGSITAHDVYLHRGGSPFVAYLSSGVFNQTTEYGVGYRLHNTGTILWSQNSNNNGTPDVGIGRNAAGVLEVNNGTSGTLAGLKVSTLDVDSTVNVDGTFLRNGELGFGYNTAAHFVGHINAVGYQEGTTQRRSLQINDGTGNVLGANSIAYFDGTSKATRLYGDLTVDGYATIGSSVANEIWLKGSISRNVHYFRADTNLSCSSAACTLTDYSGDERGRIVCTDTSATGSCTVSFATAFTDAPPACILQLESSVEGPPTISAISTSSFTFEFQDSGPQTVTYHCDGMIGE